ncbi:MAG TPA: hypothetical protein VM029_22470 [Opitutaceae bacterium]|nr:hypothetical protein [Opitutaceae bacterium]
MSLVGHMVRKDARRLAWPLAAWIALMVLPTIVFRFVMPTFAAHGEAGLRELITMMNIWVRLLTVIQLVLGYVLVAALVLEDPLGNSDAFWPTRPIGSGRLLRAKLATAALLFFAVPVLALLPVWLASGFGLREMALGAWELAKWQGGATLLALMLASLSRNLAQVMLFTVVVAIADLGSIWFITVADLGAVGLSGSSFRGGELPVRIARETVAHGLLVPVFAFVVVQQYLTRRPARGWVTLAVTWVACMAVRAAWPWAVGSGMAGVAAGWANETPADRAVEVVAEPTLTKFRPNSLPTLFVAAPWSGDQHYVPALARLSDGKIAQGAAGPGSVEAGLRALGFSKEQSPLTWQLMMPGSMHAEANPQVNGRLEVWSVRPRVIAEIPLRVGAEMKDGSTRTRIMGMTRNDAGRLDEVFIEERESRTSSVESFDRHGSVGAANQYRYIDEYFLVNRATGQAQPVSTSKLGKVEMSSLLIGFTRLFVAGGDSWENGALIKLRFECEHRFERPLDVHGVTLK